jgi:hypothetical protein
VEVTTGGVYVDVTTGGVLVSSHGVLDDSTGGV